MSLISGGGGGGGTTFNGGTITGALAVVPATDALPLSLTGKSGGSTNLMEVVGHGGATVAEINSLGGLVLVSESAATSVLSAESFGNTETIAVLTNHSGSVELLLDGANGLQLFGKPIHSDSGAALSPITSGALPTAAPVSGTAFQCSTTRDVCLVIPFTGDATNNAATLKIELSPDNLTFSILDTLSIAAALNLTGAINTPVTVAVPAGWYVKLTAVHGTIGTSTYY